MPNKILTSSGVGALILGIVFSAMPAYAGFQWVPPNGGSPQGTSTLNYQSPSVSTYGLGSMPGSATTMPETISPVIVSGQPQSTHALPSSYPSLNSTPSFSPSSIPDRPSPPTASFSAADTGTVQGFASQVPLPLALRQILPAGYNFSIDQGIDMDMLVSYTGGKSWRDTLKDMLAPAGLCERDQGTTVTISRVMARNDGGSLPASSLSFQPAPSTPFAKPTSQMAVSAEPSELPVLDTNPAEGWTAQRGETLRKVLTDWCRRAGVELQWLAEYDYPVEASAHFNNGFEDAVRNLLAGFDGAQPQPIGELHSNPTARQMVLVIQARGNSNTN